MTLLVGGFDGGEELCMDEEELWHPTKNSPISTHGIKTFNVERMGTPSAGFYIHPARRISAPESLLRPGLFSL